MRLQNLAAAPQQPFLHDLVPTVRAPSFTLSTSDGQIVRHGVQGLFVDDQRVLCDLEVEVAGAELVSIHRELVGGAGARFLSAVRGLGDPGADVSVTLARQREQTPTGLVETFELRSFARVEVNTVLLLRVRTDFASLSSVRSGEVTDVPLPSTPLPDGLQIACRGGAVVQVRLSPAPTRQEDDGRLAWPVALGRGDVFKVSLEVSVTDPAPVAVITGASREVLSPAQLTASDSRLVALYDQSVADLRSLQLADPLAEDDIFLGAGAPWYLTLFGRDSIWAARLALPLGTELAGGTLRALARRQGTRTDPGTAEQPGKILHELRRTTLDLGGLVLPPLYYGTVDATPLWISLLHDAWRWGLPDAEVAALLPQLEPALAWMADSLTPTATGSDYLNESGARPGQPGLEGLRATRSGSATASSPRARSRSARSRRTPMRPPVDGADLLDAFGRRDGDRWRTWAAELAGAVPRAVLGGRR